VLRAASLGTHKSREESIKPIKYVFLKFILHRKVTPALHQIDDDLLEEFREFISNEKSPGYLKSRHYRSGCENAIEEALRRLQLTERWAAKLAPNLKFLPKRQARKAQRPARRPKILGEASFDNLWVNAAKECEKYIKAHKARWPKVLRLAASGVDRATALRSPEAMAAYLMATYLAKADPQLPPPRTQLRGFKPRVGKQLYQDALDILFPSMRELVPMVVLVTTVFGLNAGVVKSMKYKVDYRFRRMMGREWLYIHPDKPRAGRRQRNRVIVTKNHDNPGTVIRFVESRTALLRKVTELADASLLFIAFSPKDHRPMSIEHPDEPFRAALRSFGQTCGIEKLQLSKVRPTVLDRAHFVTGGDILKVQALANHRSVSTTVDSYSTGPMVQRDEERLGDAMEEIDRLIATEGRVDVAARPKTMSSASATPGYECADPRSSPIRGENRRLCRAYGMCPICPLGSPELTAEGYALLRRLLQRVDEAQETVGGAAWVARWSRVKKEIARDLARYSPALIVAGEDAIVPDLPPVE
jgi:hypothetical protein